MQSEQFAQWINAELDQRGWSRSEAARRGRISASAMDKVINGYANPGLEFCHGIATAFGLPLEDVLHRPGQRDKGENTAILADHGEGDLALPADRTGRPHPA